jgi:toxin-antitoxin system PIN domain toxin
VWVERTFSEAPIVGIAWQTIAAFLRISTNPRLSGDRFSLREAAEVIDEWLAQPNIRTLSPGEEHWIILRRMAIEGQATGPLIRDAQLAALTIEYGGVLHTTDRDFSRFPDLRWTNPLE